LLRLFGTPLLAAFPCQPLHHKYLPFVDTMGIYKIKREFKSFQRFFLLLSLANPTFLLYMLLCVCVRSLPLFLRC
jgi:hypothetical protein